MATRDAGGPGTRTISLTVEDDDGGAAVASVDVTVLTLEGAVEHVAEELTDLLPTLDPAAADLVEMAVAALVGEQADGSADGALDHLESGALLAAMVALGDAVDLLEQLDPSAVPTADALAGTLALVAHAVTGQQLEAAADGDVVPPRQLASAIGSHDAAAAHLVLGQWSEAVADDTRAIRRVLAA